ncbi:MAG: phosphatidylglycerol lysyltransferase domain-containing protein [Rhodospirillales bacterium]|nr:phosphatidylglycerol lysyltransferase domain-containing protein [Rhodospirillales bacterium]
MSPRSVERWKTALRHAPALLGVALLIGAVYVVQREFRNLRVADIHHALMQIPVRSLAVAFGWNLAAYGVLTFYDRLGTYYAGHAIGYARVAFASFCAYALSHNLGFAAVSGAAVRYRLYTHWGLSPAQIARVIAFCSLTFGLGGIALAGTILFIEPGAVPFLGTHAPRWAMYAFGTLLLGFDILYVVLSRLVPRFRLFGHLIELPGWRMALLQVALATVDVAVTAAVFYALLPPAHGLTYMRFVGVYLASYSAGLLATLPGGIGVFDGAMLLGLAPYLPAPRIVGAILVFRLYYYIIPLFLAGSLFAGNEFLLRGRTILRGGIAPIGRISEPDFAVAAGAGAVALCGFLLLALGVLEQRPDYSWIDADYAAVAAQAGEFMPSLIGAALMVLAVAVSQRVNLAWGATLTLLLAGAALMVAQGEPLWVPGVLLLAALLIAPYRRAFYRHARLLSGPLDTATAVPLLTLGVCVLALAAFERHVRWLSDNSFWEVILSRDVPNSLRASVALTVGLGLLAMWRLLRPRRVSWAPWNAAQRLRYAALGAAPPAVADGLVWGEAERAAVPFRRLGRTLLALGDPAGNEADKVSAVWRLRDLAQQEGRGPAVWQAGRGLLGVYADLGLAALPLDAAGRLLDRGDDPVPPAAGSFLVCAPERDLPTLLPALARLGERAREHAAE